MGRLLTTKDEKTHTLFTEQDLFRLVEEYMGSEVSEFLTEKYQEMQNDLNGYEEDGHDRIQAHNEMVKNVDEEIKEMNKLLADKKLDRGKIVNAIDDISIAVHEDQWRWI